jgi:hypothetical protein
MSSYLLGDLVKKVRQDAPRPQESVALRRRREVVARTAAAHRRGQLGLLISAGAGAGGRGERRPFSWLCGGPSEIAAPCLVRHPHGVVVVVVPVGPHDWKRRGRSVSSDHGRINMRTGMQVGLLYEQSDPNDSLVDDVVMTPDRFIFRVV